MLRLVLLVFTKVGFKGSAIFRFLMGVSHSSLLHCTEEFGEMKAHSYFQSGGWDSSGFSFLGLRHPQCPGQGLCEAFYLTGSWAVRVGPCRILSNEVSTPHDHLHLKCHCTYKCAPAGQVLTDREHKDPARCLAREYKRKRRKIGRQRREEKEGTVIYLAFHKVIWMQCT